MKIRASVAAAGAAALLLAGSPAAADPPPEGNPPPVPAVTDGRPHVVTLVTGDRVRIDADGVHTFLPADGREHIGYVSMSTDKDGTGDLYVVPNDAARMLSARKLDRALFNVSALIRDGHADTGTLPLIVQYDSARLASRGFSPAGGEVTEELSSIDGQALALSTEDVAGFWSRLAPDASARSLGGGYAHVWLDGTSKVLLDQSVPQVGAPVAWEAGFDGTGVTVAVLDTGYDPAHPDLAGLVTEVKDFTGTSPEAIDGYGHGTHVASTVAGTGAASNGKYKGVAPGAKLLIGKVCDDFGDCQVSDVIAGMEWAAERGATAANLSLGGGPTDGTDPQSLALDRLSAETGTLYVVAAGNSGAPNTVGSPAAADAALAVGSVTKTDELSYFSSQGPRVGDYALKPDIAAPGSDIVAARAKGTEGETPVDEFYTGASGTSMATPHVTGAVALLKQAHPDWTGARLKSALMGGAAGLESLGVYQIGAGRLDVANALAQQVFAESASVSFGPFRFPQDQPAESRDVVYANDSDAPVTLTLDLVVLDPAGQPAEGLFSVEASTVTVPAHGTAAVTVTADPSPDVPVGAYGGVLTATADGVSVRTAVGATLEPELYDIDVKPLARDGEAVTFLNLSWTNVDTGAWDFVGRYEEDWSATLRMPPGRYDLFGSVLSTKNPADPETSDATGFSHSVVLAGADVEVVLDTSKAVESKVGVGDREDEVALSTAAQIGVRAFDGAMGLLVLVQVPSGRLYTLPGEKPFSERFTWEDRRLLVSPAGAAEPYRYNLQRGYDGGVPADGSYTVTEAELSRENGRYETQGVAAEAERVDMAPSYGGWSLSSGSSMPQSLPGSLVTYFTPGYWLSKLRFEVGGDSYDGAEENRRVVHEPGTVADVRWNSLPVGVGVGIAERDYGAFRYRDWFIPNIPMFTGSQRDMITGTFLEESGRTELLVDGRPVASADGRGCTNRLPIPADLTGRATLRCELDRSVPWSTLATRSTAEWTFPTVPNPDEYEGVAQAVSAVRLGASGVVDGYAPVKTPQVVSLTVDHSLADNPATRSLTFEVSYDEGGTWRPVSVARVGDHGVAVLKHPSGATSVSVRMSTVDKAGNTSAQTTIKAWGLK